MSFLSEEQLAYLYSDEGVGEYGRQLLIHYSSIGDCFDTVAGPDFDTRRYVDVPFPKTQTTVTYGLSEYIISQGQNFPPIRIELAIIVPNQFFEKDFSSVLFAAADLMLDRAYAFKHGEILALPELATILQGSRSSLSKLYCYPGVWLPESFSWMDSLVPMEILELLPITEQESLLVRDNEEEFHRRTAAGEIDLLDFLR